MSATQLEAELRLAVVDLLAASSGIEAEIVASATRVELPHVGELPVATAEDLLATKVLAMSDARPQDRIDARGLIVANAELDIELARARLALIRARQFHHDEDLSSKLESVLQSIR